MEDISKAISDYFVLLGQAHVVEALYQFEFREDKLPISMNFKNLKCFDKNIELKEKLNQFWNKAEQPVKGNIIEYYIKEWGGIKGNSSNKMNKYRTQNTNQLLANGYGGISSWSKALVIHNPEEYFIYDSRVAFAINYLQIRFNVNKKYAFPMPLGQSKSIKQGMRIIKSNYDFAKWQKIDKNETYKTYQTLIEKVSLESGFAKSKIEMILFSIAPNLASELIYIT
ncbi:MAG: hypothetical protein K9I82_17645 [Chitinophagaceae bacterium]|jgi:hypothetical protein|nr:hypothetical protein [Chitinophagaceae bacterium]